MATQSRDRFSRLPEKYVEDVFNNNNIVDVVAETVPLKQKGAEFVGICPFHNEKTPSFSVNGEKQRFVCRGCGKSGGLTNFLLEHRGMEFLEAVEYLAKRVNMPGPDEVRSKQPGSNGSDYHEMKLLQDVLARAEEIYKEELKKSPAAMKYLESRGINQDDIDRFGIGYAPYERNRQFLMSKMPDISVATLIKAGLAGKSKLENGPEAYELMSDRVIFPIRSTSGKTISFGGRALSPNAPQKYMNGPETSLFVKGRELYGWYEAKNVINKKKRVIIGEGYVDTVIPAGYGFTESVSCMGATVHEETLQRLFKTANEIIFCFDGDAAGIRAAQQTVKKMLPLIDETHHCSFMFLPDGYDPDEYVLEHGAEKYESMIQQSVPMSKFFIDHIASLHNTESIEGKAAFAKEASDNITKIRSTILRDIYAAGVSDAIGMKISLPAVQQQAPEPVAKQVHNSGQSSARSGPHVSKPGQSLFGFRKSMTTRIDSNTIEEPPSLSLQIVGLLVKAPEAAQYFSPKWLEFTTNSKPGEKEAVQKIVDICLANPDWTSENIKENFESSEIGVIIDRSLALQKNSVEEPIDQISNLAEFLVSTRQKVIDKSNARKAFFKKS